MTVHPRADLDFYIEPEWCTAALLSLPTFLAIKAVYDPCAGSGNVLRAARERGIQPAGSDLSIRQVAPPNDTIIANTNFKHLSDHHVWRRLGQDKHDAIAIVSNPPYGKGVTTEDFIRHFMAMRAIPVVAVFVQTRFLHSAARHGFFSEIRPTTVALLSTRPSCPPGDALLAGEVKATGGSQDYCWLIYDKRAPYEPTRTVWLKRPAQAKAVAA